MIQVLFQLISESTDIDFKETLEVKKPKSWLKSVSAFANGIGGSLFFGVADDKNIVGLDDPQTAADKISEIIKEKIEPSIKSVGRKLSSGQRNV